MTKKIFNTNDLNKIKRNTRNNAHTENLIFIAEKLNAKTVLPKLRKIKNDINKQGFLSSEQVEKRYKLYKQLLNQIKKKSKDEFLAVYQSL